MNIDKTLQQAIAHHQAGETQEAERLYRSILDKEPKHPDANHNLGVLLKQGERVDVALPFFKTALESNPKQGQFWISYIDSLMHLKQYDAAQNVLIQGQAKGLKGDAVDQLKERLNSTVKSDLPPRQIDRVITLYSQGQIEEALKTSETLIKDYPLTPILYNISGACYKALGQLEASKKSYEHALAIKPDYAEVHSNLGVTFKELGKLETAVKSYEKALAIKPDYAEAHSNLGVAFKELGQLEVAVKCYEKALAIKPDYAEAHNNLGNILKELGQLEVAVKCYEQALSIDSNNKLIWAGFSNVFQSIRFNSFNDSIVPYLLQALQQPSIRAQNISGAIISLLKHHPNLHMALETCKTDSIKDETNQLVGQLTSIPLLLQLMELCPISDTEIEHLLRLIRQASLRQLTKKTIEPTNLPLYVALALHCFTNEYVFLESLEETSEIEQLENKINSLLANNKPIPPLWVALLASYRPLHIFSWSDQLSQSNSTDSIQKILTQQIDEVREEQQLRPEIKALSSINNDISQAVREQYEENPYPRWVNPGLSAKPRTIPTVLQELKIDLDRTGQNFPSHPEILIAGCGTGQHSLGTASRFSNSSVLAVDLSLSSLSYAIRKTQELGISNIDYMHADILELHKLDRQFDHIESVGVLHHMAEPLAGWKVLVDLLRPRGLMKIGLYSEIARQHIVETRAIIEKNNYSSSQKAIRRCRVEIMEMPAKADAKISQLLTTPDFYSLSMCRDLLFHVQEHRFTLPKIETALKELGLVFIGFEFPDHQVQNRFKELDPRKESLTSLPLWHQFELNHPYTFIDMYQFWVQKI
jgi:tetratricopeptide (TPR) repeat protein/2-polyprenyl-3-methyl-5-hydroxy-6-metoxy-1,4-benzoquinol methylase